MAATTEIVHKYFSPDQARDTQDGLTNEFAQPDTPRPTKTVTFSQKTNSRSSNGQSDDRHSFPHWYVPGEGDTELE